MVMAKFKVLKEHYDPSAGNFIVGQIVECDSDAIYVRNPNGVYGSIPLSHVEILNSGPEKKVSEGSVTFREFFGQDVQQITFK